MAKPEYIIWIFTALCNLDCKHCYTYRFRGRYELSLNEKLHFARSIGEAGVEYVNLTGGEPAIHPHTATLLSTLHEYSVEKSVVTNATAIREDFLNILYRTETWVFATIDGPRELHDEVRGCGTYELAIRGVELLRKALGSVSIVSTVNGVNYKRVHEVVDYAAGVNADELALLPAMPSGRALETKLYVSAQEYLEAVNAVLQRAREYGLRVTAWCTPWAPLLKSEIGFWFCRDMSGMDVDPSGNVLLCDILDFKVTSIRGKDVAEAFGEFRNHELVKRVKYPVELPRACRACLISWGCRGGCFARSYALLKDLNRGDPLCPRIAEELGQAKSI